MRGKQYRGKCRRAGRHRPPGRPDQDAGACGRQPEAEGDQVRGLGQPRLARQGRQEEVTALRGGRYRLSAPLAFAYNRPRFMSQFLATGAALALVLLTVPAGAAQTLAAGQTLAGGTTAGAGAAAFFPGQDRPRRADTTSVTRRCGERVGRTG